VLESLASDLHFAHHQALVSIIFNVCVTHPQLIKNSPHFIEHEGSLSHSQQPIICACSEPDKYSPCPLPVKFLKIHF